MATVSPERVKESALTEALSQWRPANQAFPARRLGLATRPPDSLNGGQSEQSEDMARPAGLELAAEAKPEAGSGLKSATSWLSRQRTMKTDRSRPRKIGVSCPASWPFEVVRRRLSGNGLQVPARWVQLADSVSTCSCRVAVSDSREGVVRSVGTVRKLRRDLVKSSVISILQTCPTVEPLESSGADRPRRPRTDLAARGRRRLWSLRGESQRRNRGSGGVALDGCRRQQTRDRSCSPQVATAGSTTEWRAYGVTKQ